ncbi:hypothetical protein [Nonomuraea jiangxiensis]|uniref:WD40-like Beta Propeller Repeat n=1 Tax=Nonomuraea jiangxiensis TaxID=633440 RepID=A0A1G8SCK6_9ACTN|nr:hypothetical protein [Nonomuraea jiangxiensis]SDJ26430.1 hypothetical protein SAMN05421869_109326 [Nonomuraea jiangxiensis]
MNTIEERLRETLTARAAIVPDHLPPDLSDLSLPEPPRRGRRLAPVAVAAMIAALIAGIAVVVQQRMADPQPASIPATPPFYVGSVVTDYADVSYGPWEVYATATGARVATTLPQLSHARVAGVGDGRTFFLAGRNTDARHKRTTFYRITLNDRGQASADKIMALPSWEPIESMAAAPDGRSFAFSMKSTQVDCARACASWRELRVWDVVRSRASALYTAPVDKFPPVVGMSWLGDGHTLALSLYERTTLQARALDLSKERTGDLRSSRVVTQSGGSLAGRRGAAAFVVVTSRTEGRTLLGEFSAKTGKRLRELTVGGWFDPIGYDAKGKALLGATRTGLARLDGSRLTPIRTPPLKAGQRLVAAW